MPCDQVIQCQTKLDVCDRPSLLKGLKALGYKDAHQSGRYIYFRTKDGNQATIGDGELSVRGQDQESVNGLAGEIRMATNKEILKTACKRNGWTVKPIVGTNRFKVIKRAR